jgi:phosphomevalonate kinase
VTRISTSAPGKVLLCGEYVVLDGAPALCVAIDRRANVLIKERNSGENTVCSPGFADDRYLFSVDPSGTFTWHSNDEQRPDFSLLEKIWAATNPVMPKSVDIVLDTSDFTDSDSGRKLGLGGSAALTVALSAAIAGLQHGTVDVDRLIESHRDFQNGRGSGADIAAVFTGGLVEYRIGNPATLYPMKWRSELEFAILWSGHSVSTVEKLSQYALADSGSSRQELANASAAIVSAWSDSDVDQILTLFATYTATLDAFSNEHDLGVFDGGHAELVGLASECGVVYKPCGAGGGDVGIALSADKEAISRFTDAAAAREFKKLDLSIDDDGLTAGDKQE